jgi:hypothetical protein
MDPVKVLEMIKFIEGQRQTIDLMIESADQKDISVDVLLESRRLYDLIADEASTLDEIVAQVHKKNEAAIDYQKQTGKKWLF